MTDSTVERNRVNSPNLGHDKNTSENNFERKYKVKHPAQLLL